MIRHLICQKHGVKCQYDDANNSREFEMPATGPVRMCALLLADVPAAGALPILNEVGEVTSYSCTVVEEAG